MDTDAIFVQLFILVFSAIGRCTFSTDKDFKAFCDKDSCADSRFEYKSGEKQMLFEDATGVYLSIRVVSMSDSSSIRKPINCRKNGIQDNWCLHWPSFANLSVEKVSLNKGDCFRVIWTPSSRDFIPIDCLDMANASWFGGSELHFQRWPLQDTDIQMQPFVSSDIVTEVKSFGNVLESFWITTKGVGIFVDENTPLFVSVGEGGAKKLCLKSDYSEQYYSSAVNNILNYTVCKTRNVKEAYNLIHSLILESPRGIPDIRMMSRPIMSTWVRYKMNINQEKLLKFADEIVKNNFPHSQIEIDDMYTAEYGDFNFDPIKFPDPRGMIAKLKGKGFRITSWIIPFANLPSKAFINGSKHNYWIMDKGRNVPALVKWWQGAAATLDVTNPNAADWFVTRLKSMKDKYGIDSFKFDAGELQYFPTSYQTLHNVTNPGILTQQYVKIVSQLGAMVEVRCGYKSQRYPVFVRMADKESRWGYNNGLKTIIPTVLTLGILGYPYILPDMIGGNGYTENSFYDCVLPARELYIRWMQLTAYLPAMQFSVMPWDYDQEVVDIALNMVRIHEEVVTPILLEAAEEAQQNGSPLIRPLWWIDPDDLTAQTIDSEFLVGNNLLVAPILEEGVNGRDVYLPKGRWMDEVRGLELEGGKWFNNVHVNIHEILTFTRISDS